MNNSDIECYDIDYLLIKFKPLILANYNKYKDLMHTKNDKEELLAYIRCEFVNLCSEYNQNKGVIFSYYIKKMLDLKLRNYISSCIDTYNNECYVEEDIVVEDIEYSDIIEKLLDLYSLNPDIKFGKKHRELMVNLLIKHMTIKEIAQAENTTVERIHARMFFLKKKLQEEEVTNI